jgi:glycosyltransferase involved in cell wall biosynthesis
MKEAKKVFCNLSKDVPKASQEEVIELKKEVSIIPQEIKETIITTQEDFSEVKELRREVKELREELSKGVKNLKKSINRFPLKVLLLPDKPNWAFDNIVNAIIKYNPYPEEIEYTKLFIKDRPEIKYDDWDYVYIMFEAEKHLSNNKEKTIRGCYSAFWLERQECTPEVIGRRFSECRGAIFVNEILEEEIFPFCSNIDHTVIHDSADETVFYPIKGKKQKNFTAIFVGNTNRPIKNFSKIQQICKEAEIDLIVARDVPHERLVHEYAKADICINYSTSEGGPQTFIEAALCGVPMLIKSSNALAQKIPCFAGMTMKDMIRLLLYLKKNRRKCRRVGRLARRVALKEFTYEKTAEKFADFFLNLK